MFVVVSRSDRLRASVEAVISKLYAERYDAQLSSFARTIVVELDHPSGGFECAAGIRFGHETLFSECYLDRPIERVLQERLGKDIRRDRIVEVSHLAGVNPGRSIAFVRTLIDILRSVEIEWAIFTATRPLRALLRRNGLPMIELCRAERNRVGNPDSWGSYFAHEPRVMAVSNRATIGAKRFVSAWKGAAPAIADARVF